MPVIGLDREGGLALIIDLQNRYILPHHIRMSGKYNGWNLPYSPVIDMKWSLPNIVCRINVASNSFGPKLSFEAESLSIYAVRVMKVISSGRISPCGGAG